MLQTEHLDSKDGCRRPQRSVREKFSTSKALALSVIHQTEYDLAGRISCEMNDSLADTAGLRLISRLDDHHGALSASLDAAWSCAARCWCGLSSLSA